MDLVLSFRSSSSGRQSVRCVCSKVTLLYGVVSFTTGPTGWVDKFQSSVFLINCIACVGIVGNFIVGVRVCSTSTIIVVVIVGTVGVISGLVFFSVEFTALIPIVT